MRSFSLILLICALLWGAGGPLAQAPEVTTAAQRALASLYPAGGAAGRPAAQLLTAVDSSALGCELAAGLPLPTPIDAWRLVYAFGEASIALHISADGSLTQPCDPRLPNFGAGVIPLRRDHADSDGDGALDESDACPLIAGASEGAGCPFISPTDRDGDGLADQNDHCPEQAGSAAAAGCALLRDRDGDGVPDHSDICPDDRGIIQADFARGCPADGSGNSTRRRAQNDTCHISGDSRILYENASEQSALSGRLVPALAPPGQSAILGRTADGSWHQVAGGWLRASALRGDCYNIPLVSAGAGAATGCYLRPLSEFANVRQGPAGGIVTRLHEHELQAVLGQNRAGDWLFYREGWVSRSVLELSGDCQRLPALNPARVGSGTRHFCPPGYAGFLAPRIGIGELNARIASETLANRLRAAPELSAAQIGEIPPRAVIDAVLDGPACNPPFVWWQVRLDGAIGWTVESDFNANHYYLEPVAAADHEPKMRRPSDSPRRAAGRMIHGANAQLVDTLYALALESPRAVSWSPAGNWLAAIDGAGKVALYRVAGFAAVEMEGPTRDHQDFTALAFSPAGAYLALGDAAGAVTIARANESGGIISPQAVGSLDSAARALAWSQSGDRLAAISGDDKLRPIRRAGTLKLWDTGDDPSRAAAPRLYHSFPFPLTAVAFSRDERWLAVAGESISSKRAALWIYEATTGALRLSKPLLPMAGQATVVTAPAAELGDFVYSSGDSLYQIDSDSGRDWRFYQLGGRLLERVALRPSVIAGAEVLLAVMPRDRNGAPQLQITNALSAHAPRATLFTGASALAFSPDGVYLAAAQPEQNRVLILGIPAAPAASR